TRDFVYVGDVVAALMAALERQGEVRELPVYNVARGESVSLLELLDIVGGLPGVASPLNIGHGEPRLGDIRHSLANSGRLRGALAWAPKTSVAEGLAAILAN